MHGKHKFFDWSESLIQYLVSKALESVFEMNSPSNTHTQ